jgi:broad specificity phosphatase PhoE
MHPNSIIHSTLYNDIVRPSIKVYMIRHAESANNEVYRNARLIYKGGTPQFDYHGWENYVNKNRAADPTISSTGIKQATKLKEYLVPHLNHQASQPVKVITSPMTRTIKTILPTLQALKREKVDLVVNGLYFESEGCHLKGTPLPGMNQNEIKDILSQSIDIGDTQSDTQSDNQSDSTIHAHDPTFVGFHEDPNLGWYNYGLGPETRSESEVRATAFYTWLCEYLDEQLMSPNIEKNDNDNGNDDIYDAGVTLPEEVDEIDHDKLSERHRRRRTVILVGHGDFMSLCLKRIISGFGHSVENFGITHRTAFTHFNTGITELEYFGKGMLFISCHVMLCYLEFSIDTILSKLHRNNE